MMKLEVPDDILSAVDESVSAGMMEFIDPRIVKAMIRDMRRMRQQIEDLETETARLNNALELRTLEYERTDDALRLAQDHIRKSRLNRAEDE